MFDSSVYNKEFFQSLEQYDPFLETALLAVFAYLGVPRSMIDFGCGNAHTLEVARRNGVIRTMGSEISTKGCRSAKPATNWFIHDLREPIDLDWLFDLVLCWEVAEHLPEESANVLCETLAQHTGKWLVFTAAQPGASGHHHLNEQHKSYWIDKIEQTGLEHAFQDTMRLREIWRFTTGPCHWLPENLLVFKADEE